MTSTLSKVEVKQRVALLKRLKQTLTSQRQKFQAYLQLLDAEKGSVQRNEVDELRAQVELEDELVAGIQAFQKVIEPLEAVYRESYGEPSDAEVLDLRSSLASLKGQVSERSRENRSLLSKSMEVLSGEIVRLRPHVRGRGPYASSRAVSSLVDITT